METQEEYITRCKEEIINDVFNVARLDLVGGYLDENGILNLKSGYDIEETRKYLIDKMVRTAKHCIVTNQI